MQSEQKLAHVLRWQRPVADEPALIRLIADTEEQTRFKLNSVNRLRNTILYAEKVRQEWEAKANTVLLRTGPEVVGDASNLPPFDSPQLQPLSTVDSPRIPDSLLELPTSLSALHRNNSHLFGGALSPLLSPQDTIAARASPAGGINLTLSPRIPSGLRTKESSIKDFKILKPISKGACESLRRSLFRSVTDESLV